MDGVRARPSRVRVAALGAVTVLLGAGAHGGAGGALPSLGALSPGGRGVLGAVAALAVVAVGLAGRAPLRTGPVLALLGSVQVALHLVLEGLADAPTHHAGHGLAHHAGHHADAGAVAPGMVLAHLVVTVLAAAGLAGAERSLAAVRRVRATLGTVGRAAMRALRPLRPGPSRVPAPRRAVPPVAPCPSTGVLVVRRHRRRGPPMRTSVTSVSALPRHRRPPCREPGRRAPSPA